MKIAMICFGDVRRPEHGYAKRCRMLMLRLAAQGNMVEVFQFCDATDTQTIEGVTVYSLKTRHEKRQKTPDPIQGLLGFNPFSELYFQIEGLMRLVALRKRLRQADQIYIEGCLILHGFVLAKLWRKPIVLDTHCINKEIALKLRPQQPMIGWLRMVVWHVLEKTLLRAADRLIFVSAHDQEAANVHYGTRSRLAEVIENDVDAADIEQYKPLVAPLRRQLGLDDSFVACFVGDLGAIQNDRAEQYIRLHLAPATPRVTYMLVGRNPRSLSSHGNIAYTDFVDVLDPYILMADICIAPLEVGSGTKTKMLDYLKYNKQILSTPIGAEGLDINGKKNVSVVELNQFATRLNDLVRS